MTSEISGTYMEASNREAACPCVVFSPPTEDSCTAVLGWHIGRGSFDGTKLDGLNVAILVHAPGNMKDGGWTVSP